MWLAMWLTAMSGTSQGQGEHLGGTHTDQQSTHQAGRVVHRDAADVLQRDVGLP